jgi:hypothetical protein
MAAVRHRLDPLVILFFDIEWRVSAETPTRQTLT